MLIYWWFIVDYWLGLWDSWNPELEYLSTNWDSGLFRGSCEVVLAAVQNDGVALAYAAAELQSSREALAVGAGRGDIFSKWII